MPTPIITLPIHTIEQARALAGLLRAFIDGQQPDTNEGADWKPDPDLAGQPAKSPPNTRRWKRRSWNSPRPSRALAPKASPRSTPPLVKPASPRKTSTSSPSPRQK